MPGEQGGSIDATQLDWLQADLAQHAEQPTVVFVHHHLWPIGVRWMDLDGLQNADELEAVLRTHPQVRWMICGHVHQDHHAERDGLTQLTTSATCFQISKVSQTPKLFPGPPSFRLVEVKGTTLSTRVIHLHYDNPDDF